MAGGCGAPLSALILQVQPGRNLLWQACVVSRLHTTPRLAAFFALVFPCTGLFSWQQAPPASVQRTAAQLLALAAAGGQDYGAAMNGSSSSCGGPVGRGAIASDPTSASIQAAHEHLLVVRALAGRAAAGEKLSDGDLAPADLALESLTLAGLGLLHLVKGVLGSGSTYEDDRSTSSVPSLLALLRKVVAAQPAQVPAVVHALQGALTAMGARRPELSERVGEALVELLLVGRVDEVLAAAEAWAVGGADPSLVRAFALRILDRAGPPYSREFARPLLRLIAAGKMGMAKKAGTLGGGGAVERLREFAAECLDVVDFVPRLLDEETDLLEKLVA